MSPRFVALAVSLPLLAIAFGIARAELFLGGTRDFVFEIEGFDPRDLLRGHYLEFRLRLEPLPEGCGDRSSGCCLCLTRASDHTIAEPASCATARTRCDGVLAAAYAREPFRYYVPEEHAANLERRLQDAMQRRRAHAVLAVDPHGKANVRELRIDGRPIPGGTAR